VSGRSFFFFLRKVKERIAWEQTLAPSMREQRGSDHGPCSCERRWARWHERGGTGDEGGGASVYDGAGEHRRAAVWRWAKEGMRAADGVQVVVSRLEASCGMTSASERRAPHARKQTRRVVAAAAVRVDMRREIAQALRAGCSIEN
jgi:hypothetical protein